MSFLSKKKGFTLIELLVVVAIIGVLATIIIASLGSARLKAKDAAVLSGLSGYRNEAEIQFEGQYTGLCSSSSYTEIQTYINSQGGSIDECFADTDGYRIIANLPSELAFDVIQTAYAAGENGVCVNSRGFAQLVVVDDANSLNTPYCSIDEDGATVAGGGSGGCPPTCISDSRFKRNIENIKNALDKVLRLRGVSYYWNDKGVALGEDKEKEIGFVAQEIYDVVPEVVSIDSSGIHTVEYGKLSGLLVEAIKEMEAENQLLKKELCSKDETYSWCN